MKVKLMNYRNVFPMFKANKRIFRVVELLYEQEYLEENPSLYASIGEQVMYC